MKTKNIYISLIALFLLAAFVFGGIWFYQSRDAVASEETFNELEDMIVQPTENPIEPDSDEPATGDEEISEEKINEIVNWGKEVKETIAEIKDANDIE